eukprot:scaffold188513_cov19-Tisochrysis_lutea.AAC.3
MSKLPKGASDITATSEPVKGASDFAAMSGPPKDLMHGCVRSILACEDLVYGCVASILTCEGLGALSGVNTVLSQCILCEDMVHGCVGSIGHGMSPKVFAPADGKAWFKGLQRSINADMAGTTLVWFCVIHGCTCSIKAGMAGTVLVWFGVLHGCTRSTKDVMTGTALVVAQGLL